MHRLGASAAIDEARGLDVGFELLGQRAGLEHRNLRRQFEFFLGLELNSSCNLAGVASPADLDRELEEVVAALVHRFGAEIADLGVAEDEVLEVLLAEVDAADLEEAGGAVRMLDARENRERPCPVLGFAISNEVARAPAQERRD